MSDAITDLGYCAAVCELEAHLCPWDGAELKRRAEAYRGEQLRLLGLLPQLLDAGSATASAEPRAGRPSAARTAKPRVKRQRKDRRSDTRRARTGAAEGPSRKI
ncbi:MAG TPA: hypothetical protein VMU71_10275 [Terracidiphilus sp.]|nr:hypothetical protein [Terracidiphilus sp.]